MSDILRSMAIAALIWAAVLTVFFFLVNRRWFARFSQGFFLTVLIGFAVVSLMAASVVGTWGYEASKSILWSELIVELTNVADIVESQVGLDIDRVRVRLDTLATGVGPLLKPQAAAERVREELLAVQRFNPMYLQLHVRDADGKLVAATSVTESSEPANRIGAAFALEGKTYISDAYESPVFKRQVLYVSVPVKDEAGAVIGTLSTRFDLQADLLDLIKAAQFNVSGYAVIVGSEGRVLAHRDPNRIGDDISSYEAVQRARKTAGSGSVVEVNKAGQEKLMIYRALKSPASVEPKPWVLLTEIDQSEALAPLRRLRDEFAAAVAVLILVSLLVALTLSKSIRRPVHDLVEMVQKVKGGDLTARIGVEGHDAIGQLGASLNDMARGLQERDRVKEVFGRYIATQVSEKLLKGDFNMAGESRHVTILFSDIRNFSTMSEQMTPAQVVSFLNDYFSEMVEAVFEQGGVLDKFIGDGLMAVYGSLGDQPDHPRRAVLTALRMKARLAKINGERSVAGKPPIAIGIGVHTDDVIVGNIGTRKRLEYTVIGDGVNTSSRVQALNKEFGTTILITETTHEAVKDEFDCRAMPEAHLRGKVKTLRFFEVLSSKNIPTAAHVMAAGS